MRDRPELVAAARFAWEIAAKNSDSCFVPKSGFDHGLPT